MNTVGLTSSSIINLTSLLAKNILEDSVEKIIKSLALKLLSVIVKSSYYIFLIYGMTGYIMYMFGYEKSKNAPTIAIGAYLIIKVVGGVLLG